MNKFLEHIEEKRTLLNNILIGTDNWIGHYLRINCLLHDFIEREMMEVKGLERRAPNSDDLRNRSTN